MKDADDKKGTRLFLPEKSRVPFSLSELSEQTTLEFSTRLPVPSPRCRYQARARIMVRAITTGLCNIWVVMGQDPGNTIARIDPTTHAVTEFSVPLPSGPPATGIPGALLGGITAGPDGNIWFTELGVGGPGQIGMINLATDVITQVPAPINAEGITAGPDGNVWFISWTGSSIAMIDPNTDDITTFPLPIPIPSPYWICTHSGA